jgi:hypothetical protein
MRIVVEPHIDYRAASSLAAAEQFEPHLSSLDGGSRGYTNPNVAKTNFRSSRQATYDETERSARLSGELPTPQTALVLEVVTNEHRTDARSPQRLIGRPFQAPPIGTTNQQHASPIDAIPKAGWIKRVFAVDDDQRPFIAHRGTRGSQGTACCPGAGPFGQPFNERPETKAAARQLGI